MPDSRKMPDAPFKPLLYVDGYLPIEDHGLIGDGATAALVGRGGAVSWLCVPRFDSPPIFCGILDPRHGGAFTIAPRDGAGESRQCYVDDSGVLVTDIRSPSGVIRISDALTLRPGVNFAEPLDASRHELLRHVEVLSGTMTVRVSVEPVRGTTAERQDDGLRLRRAGSA